MTSYIDLVNRLYQVNRDGGVKLGLQNSLDLHRFLGEPAFAYPVVHVGGTNGKGSVATKVAAALRAGGYRVGLYTSPHLTSFCERIRVNGEAIAQEDVTVGLPLILEAARRHSIRATFFELTTLFALDHFARVGVDVAVVEVGLGGRLDATNVVEPVVSAITSIGLDHTDLLGNSLREIAFEKGGIIKPGRPIVLGPAAQQLGLEEIAEQRGAPLVLVRGRWNDYRLENGAIAEAVLKAIADRFPLTPHWVATGLAAQPPCRFEQVGRVVLDVAHNRDGVRRLMETLQATGDETPLRAIVGVSIGKDAKAILAELRGKFSAIHLVSSDHPRLQPVDALLGIAERLGLPLSSPHGDCERVVAWAAAHAEESCEKVVVLGSCFLMGAAQKAIGRTPLTDPLELNEVYRISP